MSFAAFSFGFDDPAQVESLPNVALPSGTPALTGTDSWSLVLTGVTGGGVSGSGKAALEVEGDPLEFWCCGVVAVRSGGHSAFVLCQLAHAGYKLIKRAVPNLRSTMWQAAPSTFLRRRNRRFLCHAWTRCFCLSAIWRTFAARS